MQIAPIGHIPPLIQEQIEKRATELNVSVFLSIFNLIDSEIFGLHSMTEILIKQSHRVLGVGSIIKEFERLQSCILLDVTP